MGNPAGLPGGGDLMFQTNERMLRDSNTCMATFLSPDVALGLADSIGLDMSSPSDEPPSTALVSLGSRHDAWERKRARLAQAKQSIPIVVHEELAACNER